MSIEKLKILADAAKYDVSCASSGSSRKNEGGLGNSAPAGICHSYTEDGRCVSLLKILLTNHCIFDCAYCINRSSNDIRRAAFTVQEVVDITINFYRRNYIEGLFLSSGIFKNADYTMERLVRIAKRLRQEHNFHGYIHLKAIPGASNELMHEAGLYADRLSVNIELPSEQSLKLLAPGKNYADVYQPMNYLAETISEYKSSPKKTKNSPKFAPAGQSTQLVIGASQEQDLTILKLANDFYKNQQLKRVYYSGYIPVSDDNRLPMLQEPPLRRENRLYQADWLMRFYKFRFDEIVSPDYPDLELNLDPKMAYALRNFHLYPIDINKADYEMLLRVPGLGLKSARLIVQARRHGRVNVDHLKKMKVVLKRARYFISNCGLESKYLNLQPEKVRSQLLLREGSRQLSLF